MLRKEKFVPNEYYHIYSRIIFNIPEFKDYKNAQKLTQAFLLANSTKSGSAFDYLRTVNKTNWNRAVEIAKEGKQLVNVLCYTIMPDHYHLLLRELRENGIVDFTRKCNTSIAKYINIKKNRTGPLFESRFKSKHIDSNKYLLHLSLYIHLNPLDFLDNKNWRKNELKIWSLKKKKLLSYPWSSLKSYTSDNFKNPIISGTEVILNQFADGKEYESFLREWSTGTLKSIENILID